MKSEALKFKWFVPDDNRFSIEQWECNAVVFNFKTGETHKLNALSVDVLKLIQKQPVSFNTLTEEFYNLYDVEDHHDMDRQLESLISQFDTLGLIEPFIE